MGYCFSKDLINYKIIVCLKQDFLTSVPMTIEGWNTMIKIGCKYLPKVTRLSIGEYPKYFQVGEVESRKLLHEKSLKMLKNGEYFDPTGYAFILFGDPTVKIK